MGTSFAQSFVRDPAEGTGNRDSQRREALGRTMRPMTNQIADRLPMQRAMRREIIGVAGLLLLVAFLSACGGSGRGPGSDPRSEQNRDPKHYQEEQRLLVERMAGDPLESYWPYRMAEIQVALDSTAQAQTSLDRVLELDPDHEAALLLLSKLYYEGERYEAASSMLQGALDRKPQHGDALRMALAINLDALGELEAAEQLIAQCEEDPQRRRGVETFLSLRGDGYLESRAIAEAAVESDPENASNHNNLGVSLLYEGDPEAARDAFLRALELDPQLAGALYNLAIVETYYFYDLDKGRSWFERYAQLESEDPDELGAVFGVDLAARDGRGPASMTSSESTDEAEGSRHAQ